MAQRFHPWPEPRGHSLVKAGLAHLYRGEHGPAEACFRRAEALLEADTWLRWRWHSAAARVWELALTQGRHDEAWTYATQSLELATQTDSRKHVARAQRLQGESWRQAGDSRKRRRRWQRQSIWPSASRRPARCGWGRRPWARSWRGSAGTRRRKHSSPRRPRPLRRLLPTCKHRVAPQLPQCPPVLDIYAALGTGPL